MSEYSRREFLTTCGVALCFSGARFSAANSEANESVPFLYSRRNFDSIDQLQEEFQRPPREFTLLPFWFWNDELSKDELARQIADFEAKGVYGFTIHPRIGLPYDTGWMSPKLLDAMRFALDEARKRKMFVLLYDEGMYPSGSSAGQVVAEDASYAARGFIRVPVDDDGEPLEGAPRPESDWNDVGRYAVKDKKWEIYDAPSKGVIRGLHYTGDESNRPGEFSPPASDLLNPDAVDCFIRLVYQRFYDEFEEFFKDGTVVGIFTDEPSILGRGPRRDMRVGNLASLPTINKYLGYDFKPYLIELWENATEESARRRAEYVKASRLALEEIYYGRISKWCVEHNTSLCGHPELSSDVGVLRKFQIPGQDIVWRYIEPGAKAFDSTHSMMAKVASSAMIHNGARRNLNEIFGAFGHNFTYEEMVWLINWCVARGQNMFVPHAFYYSIRGPRLEERPPDVGPNSPWWDDYKSFADYCERLSWLNTDSTCVAPIAMLVDSDFATTWGVRALTRRQFDFNYLEIRALDDAEINAEGIALGTAFYKLALLPPGATLSDRARERLAPLVANGRVARLTDRADTLAGATTTKNDDEMLAFVERIAGKDVDLVGGDAPGLRVRHVVKGGADFYFLFNEEDAPIDVRATFAADDGACRATRWNPRTGAIEDLERSEDPRIFAIKLEPRRTDIVAFVK